MVAHMPRNGRRQIISERYANSHKRNAYYDRLGKSKIIAACEANAVPDDEIDFSDIPEVTDFSRFEPCHPEYFKTKREQVSIQQSK